MSRRLAVSSYLHDGVLIYLEHMVDWDLYFKRVKGDAVDVEA